MDSRRLKREIELNKETVKVGTEFWREKINYGYLSSNNYFKCKVIAIEKSNITFEQYNEYGKKIATRSGKIGKGYIKFSYESGYTDNSSINSKLIFK